MPIFCVFETDVFVFQKGFFCYIKRPKSFFHDLFSRSMTWECRGLQGVTVSYTGLQGVTRGYRGLQGVTRGYWGLQRVTRRDRGRQGVTWGYKGL